jgi:hypothetical protein
MWFVIACVLAAAVGAAAEQTDDIRIVSIDPPVLSAGVETRLTIDVDVILETGEEAVVRVGFNVNSPDAFRMVDSHDVQRGRQRVTFDVTVVPIDWGDRGDFAVIANVGTRAPQSRWTPTASVRKTIPVKSSESLAHAPLVRDARLP